MTDEIEITVDGRSFVGGVVAGLLLIAPNVTPLLFSGLQTAFIASNALYFQMTGLTVLFVTVLFSATAAEGGVQIHKESFYSSMSVFLLLAIVGYAAVPATAVLTGPGDTGQITGDNLRTATLDVDGMVCQGCRLTVKNYLESMPGTKRVTASLSKKEATVVYDSTKTSAQELANSKVFQGAYSATIKTDRAYEGAT
jgi:mercuric ion binding protein